MTRNPFYLMAGLYLVLDALALAAMALVTAGVLPPIPGLDWLRVHLLTIGVATQVVLGALPGLVAAKTRSGSPSAAVTWATWVLVNLSFVLLQIGMPAGQAVLASIAAVGVLAAVLLSLASMWRLGPGPAELRAGLRFYLVAPIFLLVGILLAISMLLAWWAPGGFAGLLEAHVHANVWGFLGLVAAGGLLERIPKMVGRPLRFPSLIARTSYLLIAGAAVLVAGPWLGSVPLTMLGLVVYVAGTALLLANLLGTIVPSRGWTPNLAHLLIAYVWMIVPVAVAPAYLATVGRLPTGGVEAAAVGGLVAGWVLQMVLGAFVPKLRADQPGVADGHWLSVIALNLGVLAIWVAAFWEGAWATLTASGYALVVVALVFRLVVLLWRAAPGARVSGRA